MLEGGAGVLTQVLDEPGGEGVAHLVPGVSDDLGEQWSFDAWGADPDVAHEGLRLAVEVSLPHGGCDPGEQGAFLALVGYGHVMLFGEGLRSLGDEGLVKHQAVYDVSEEVSRDLLCGEGGQAFLLGPLGEVLCEDGLGASYGHVGSDADQGVVDVFFGHAFVGERVPGEGEDRRVAEDGQPLVV